MIKASQKLAPGSALTHAPQARRSHAPWSPGGSHASLEREARPQPSSQAGVTRARLQAGCRAPAPRAAPRSGRPGRRAGAGAAPPAPPPPGRAGGPRRPRPAPRPPARRPPRPPRAPAHGRRPRHVSRPPRPQCPQSDSVRFAWEAAWRGRARRTRGGRPRPRTARTRATRGAAGRAPPCQLQARS